MTHSDTLARIIMAAPALRSVPASARMAAFRALPESARLQLVAAHGLPPEVCGPELPNAPARGPLRVFDVLQSYPDGADGSALKPGGFAGRRTAQRLDAFGVMQAQSERRGGCFTLTDSQIGMGRIYGAMVQDHDAGAVRGISIETMMGARGGTVEGFTDHRLDLSRRIDTLRGRVGDGCALAIRRVRPSARGGADRRNIPDRALVDAVCVADMTLGDVLARYGWSVYGDTVRAAMTALAAALDRMIGPKLHQPIVTAHF